MDRSEKCLTVSHSGIRLHRDMMKAYLSAALFVCIFGTCLGETTYFDCFKDRCIRGKQYCVPTRERCYLCDDIKEHCGTSVMPRDCDSYCMELSLKDVELRLNSTLDESMALEETVSRIQKLLENSTNELEIVKEKNARLEKEKDKQNILVEAVENKLKNIQEDKLILIIALVLAILLVVLLGAFLVIFKSRQGRCRCRKDECNLRKNLEDPESQVQLSTEGEETDKLIPGAGVTKDSSVDNTNESEDSAGMVDDEDTSDTTSYRNESDGDGAGGTEVAGRREEENCWRKNTPEALKGIQPTVNQTNDYPEKVFG